MSNFDQFQKQNNCTIIARADSGSLAVHDQNGGTLWLGVCDESGYMIQDRTSLNTP
jgi:hypothetical protein